MKASRPRLVATAVVVTGALGLTLLAGSTSPAAATSPGAPILKVQNQPLYANGRWGMLTQDLSSKKYLTSQNAQQFFIPGSNAKLFSTAALWGTLGPNYRFQTPVFRTGPATNGTLSSNLVLVASGDLTMGGRTKPDGTVDFENFDHADANALPGFATLTPENPLAGLNKLAQQVRASGIKKITGNVVIDDRLFDVDTEQNEEVPTYPISINDNLIDVIATPKAVGQKAGLDWRPKTAAYTVTSNVTTGAAGSAIKLSSKVTSPGHLLLSGSVPAGHAPVVYVHQIEDPPAFARTAFIEALRRAGVTVTTTSTGANPAALLPAKGSYAPSKQVAVFVSPKLSEYIKLIMKVSLNVGANLSVCLLAVHDHESECLDGLPAEQRWLSQTAKVDTKQLVLNDGQGASQADLVTPQAVVDLLRYMQSRPDFARYRSVLPILGVDGSLAGVVPKSPAAGHVFAKTGTLAGPDFLNGRPVLSTKALGGYIKTKDGRLLAFSLLVNNVPIQDVNDVLTINTDLGKIAALLWAGQR
ncbi:MAG TPA: D-alanyl-D-alanine carboxypeptidase/D-alanyl-D-alanine-endopeptidase [Frankiaceae bacterium]|nr:D-alanyl-D-alanine carboxypeptidase/D-alanyl-D-alanine-endopeptidase [Frankiaceae bacterium]